ncbi:hypothetical protein [Xanthomonas sp. SI]|uniref:hypothetical protein n=1 Tax=Xanthomonas sp. SI TaxID=2724123 RepID=UPI00163AE160|nr:hypothetical protein [Xanthomonas sp. SI]
MLNFYVYVDGTDLDQCEAALTRAFSEFATKSGLDSKVINDKYPRTPDLGPEDLPDWNLGFNFSTSNLSETVANELASFLTELSQQTDREFVVGLWHPDNQISDDLMSIGADSPRSKGAELCLMVNGR